MSETLRGSPHSVTWMDGPQAGVTRSAASLTQQQVSDALDREADEWNEQRAKTRAEWKRRQEIQTPQPRWLAPTLPERINRLRPSERHELQSMIRSIKLRKIIRRTLAEAFWARETQTVAESLAQPQDSMQRLRATVRAHESLMSYERALTKFEPAYVRSTYGIG